VEALFFESLLSFRGSRESIVRLFELRRWHVAERLEESRVVEPVDPFEGRELDLLEALPGPLVSDDLGLVEADDALGEGVDAPIAVKRPPRGLWTLPEGVASAPRSRVRGTVSNSG